MTSDGRVPDVTVDGFTVDELADYLERGRTPRDPAIEASAACRLALADLERLSSLTAGALEGASRREPPMSEMWIHGLLTAIRAEVDAGRDLPVRHPDPSLRLSVTEAAVRTAVRRAGDTAGGAVIGRCALDGDLADPDAPIHATVTCSIAYGHPIGPTADRLRRRIADEIVRQTERPAGRVDVVVDDVHVESEAGA